MKRNLILLLGLLAATLALGQNPYVREGSIGTQTAKSDSTASSTFPYRPISKWVGERFIFLPQPGRQLQEFGYMSFRGGDGSFGQPSYEKYVGRIARVTNVSEQASTQGIETGIWDVSFEMEDTKQKLTATAYMGSLHGIASVADIDSARAKWLGKSFYYTKGELSTYHEDKDTCSFGSVKIRRFVPVKVIDVVAGWDEHEPVRLIVRTDSGFEGFVDLNVSGTNVAAILQKYSRFEEYFLTEDPRTTHPWSRDIWSAIEGSKVFIGMTSEQARWSWGSPSDVNATITSGVHHEQWVYGNGSYLYLDDGVVTGIQN
jgi:hypothetical protein